MELRNKFDNGQFAILAEMDPPKGTDVTYMVKSASRVKGVVDAFVVPEMGNAVMRMSALGAALLLQGRGMETVMQVCCRDRNRLALQADLLAAAACGIQGILVVDGEDPSHGDHHQARPVYDLKLMALLEAVRTLQAGRDMAGIELAGSPEYLVGALANAGVTGKDLDREMVEMDNKIAAGVEFFILPPVFDLTAIDPFLSRAKERRTRIIPTVLLLKSLGMARYMMRNMDHVHIPATLIEEIQKSPDKARACTRIAARLIGEIRAAGFPGVNLVTIGWENRIPEILGGMGV